MKNILRVTATVAATMLLGTQTLMPATVFADNQSSLSAQQILAQLDTEEQEKFETLTDYLGITDLNAFFDEVRSQSYSSDDYIDLDGDGDLTLDDALFVAQFLNGMVDYPYDYNDMDATNDHVIDEADAMAYMSCYSYHILFHNPFTPGSHGAARTIDAARSYRRFVFTQNGGSEDPETYTLSLNYELSNRNIETMSSNIQNRMTGEFYDCYDTRIVKLSGSGVIIGPHTILTNAHTLTDEETAAFKYNFDVSAYTYPNNVATSITLTPVSFHVPADYYLKDQNGAYIIHNGVIDVNPALDYGLIVVEEDLSDYGEFQFGVALDGLSTSTSLALAAFPQNNDPNNHCNMINGHRVKPLISYGNPTSLSSHSICNTCHAESGSSGGGLYMNNGNQSLIGIHYACSTNHAFAVRICAPIMTFARYNPVVIEEEEAICQE